MRVTLTLNGSRHETDEEPTRTLAALLGEDHGMLTGNPGCADGTCGACTVLVNGQAVRSCLMLAVQCHDDEVVTLEGLAPGHPLRAALPVAEEVQCGFCLPGFVMLAAGAPGQPGEPGLASLLNANVCWCGRREQVQRAVLDAAAEARQPD